MFLVDQERTPLEWVSRQKIALGTARGLRYLHQECRVGCIVHRDLRPNNIVVTHDFEPMVRSPCFVGVAYQGKDIVFRFIIEYNSLRDFGP